MSPTRWGVVRRRRTNPENRGEPTYPWWRLEGWTPVLAGRAFGARTLATIWHVEPGGRDAFEVCDRRGNWRWHVRHWKVQVHALQGLRARLFDRCEECGRKGRPNISHQWDGPRLGWWKFQSRRGLYHRECSSLVHVRSQAQERLWLLGQVLDPDDTDAVLASLRGPEWTKAWRVFYDLKNARAREAAE